jgi:carbon-monoxide dehydrogenase medium subunit
MKAFSFTAPTTIKEMNEILTNVTTPGEIHPIVGGTDLIEQVKTGRRSPSIVMDIKQIPEMNRLEWVSGEGLHLGAAVSCTDTAAFPLVQESYESIKESCGLIGSVQIQNRASIVGNIANSAPSADSVPSGLVHEASVVLIGPSGTRTIPLEDFFTGPGRNVSKPNEVVLEIILPPPPNNSSSHYLRFIPRNEMDIAVAGVATLLSLAPGSRTCTKARIALASVGPIPVRAKAAETFLEGKDLTNDIIEKAAETAVESASPITDVRGSIEYRKNLVKVLTENTLRMCLNSLNQNL